MGWVGGLGGWLEGEGSWVGLKGGVGVGFGNMVLTL